MALLEKNNILIPVLA